MRILRALFVVITIAAVAIILIPPVRVAVLALLLLPHFFPGDVFRPLQYVTPAPTVETIVVPGTPGRMTADIYRPAGDGRMPAMILFLGVNPFPRNHPQVSLLAEGIARTGVATVVAESDALLNGQIRLEEIDNLVVLFQHLERDERIDPRHIGFAGFCVGAVLELLAASDERIADRVAYVNAFSVYADAVDVLRSVLTASQPTAGGSIPWSPSELTRKVFVEQIIQQVPQEQERAMLLRAFVDNTPLTFGSANLSPSASAVLQLMVSREPAEVDRILRGLPAAFLAPLERLSPARTASKLRARVFLMHDVNDTYLPVAGARKLAAALPPATNPQYAEFQLFSHVVPGQVDDPVRFVGEMLKLVGHINAVLQVAHFG